MSDIAILKEMIKESARVPLVEDDKGKRRVVLKEPPPADYSVTIDGMPDNDRVIVIKADAFPAPKAVFIGSNGECKRADFVIIADGKKKVILCIEMKAGKGESETDIIAQLKGAKCFVAYCQEIGKLFWNKPNFLKDYEYRFVSIKNIKLNKTSTRYDPTPHFFSDIQILKRNGAFFQFNDLLQCKR